MRPHNSRRQFEVALNRLECRRLDPEAVDAPKGHSRYVVASREP